MKTETIHIVDLGRGPQIEGHRLTVLDVFYYLHRGYDFDFIHRALPSLTRDEFDAVVEYVNEHRDALEAQDRRVEERVQQGISDQKAKGLHQEIVESVPVAERAARLKEKLHQTPILPAENNGGHAPR